MELREYLIPLRKWWWLIVAATLVGALSSYLASRQQPYNYAAKATLMVGRSIQSTNPQDSEMMASQQLGQTYANLAVRRPIKDAVRASLGLTWLPEYTVRMVANTQLLEIQVIDINPLRAQAVANEVANQLIQQTPAEERDLLKRREYLNRELQQAETIMDETKAEIQTLRDQMANMFSARQIADTQNQIAALGQKLSSYQEGYMTAMNFLQGGVNTLQVVEPADLPVAPVGPDKVLVILLAAAIGFVLAAGAAYLLEYLDDTLKNPDDVTKTMELTTLGAVPILKSVSGSVSLPMLSEGQSAASEAYRVLRTNLQFAAVDRPLRTLMITSPAPNEGKSFTAANLAAAIAQAGKQVVLVDTDLHRPKLHRLFGLRNHVGLTTALLAEKPVIDSLLQPTSVPGLSVLTSGPLPPNPAELLGSGRMRELVDALGTQTDIVVFDTPPVMVLADTAVLSSQVDGVLMVVSAGETRREIARRAMVALKQVNARVLGALLNRMPVDPSGYYYYYYQHGDYYGDASDGRDESRPGGGNGGGSRGLSQLGRNLLGRKGPSRPAPAPER